IDHAGTVWIPRQYRRGRSCNPFHSVTGPKGCPSPAPPPIPYHNPVAGGGRLQSWRRYVYPLGNAAPGVFLRGRYSWMCWIAVSRAKVTFFCNFTDCTLKFLLFRYRNRFSAAAERLIKLLFFCVQL